MRRGIVLSLGYSQGMDFCFGEEEIVGVYGLEMVVYWVDVGRRSTDVAGRNENELGVAARKVVEGCSWKTGEWGRTRKRWRDSVKGDVTAAGKGRRASWSEQFEPATPHSYNGAN